MMRMMRIEKTKSGLPAAWEIGGGRTNTGEATIWASPSGDKPRAIYVRRRGHLACANHALVVVRPGMVVVQADHHRGDFRIKVSRVVEVRPAASTVRRCPECGSTFVTGENGTWGCWRCKHLGTKEEFTCEIPDGFEAVLETIAEFSEGEWQPALLPEFEAAVEAAKAKALCYHCREPHYIEEQAG